MPAGLTRALGLAGLALVAALAVVWALGGLDLLESQAVAAQRSFRDALAVALRALRRGEDGALWSLVGLAFGYGVLHAAGPGHGKVLIGGYGVARRVALVRLAGLALVSSLAQATVAVAVVYGGLGLFGVTREAIGLAGDGWMVALGQAMMAGIGLWLVWRGVQGLRRASRGAVHVHGDHAPPGQRGRHHSGHHHSHHDHADHGHANHRHAGHAHAGHDHPDHVHHDHGRHDHDHPLSAADVAACDTCGHRHAPSLSEVEAATGWREMAALVAGIAVRPCTGALMLLVLTWQLGLVWTGVLGAYAMGLGTALITTGVAVLAVTAREGAFAGFPGLARARAALPVVEILIGGTIAGLALAFLARSV